MRTRETGRRETDIRRATFAAGCFWGPEDVFRRVSGVESVTVGYAGGSTEHPTYEQVCTGLTGHAESVQVLFDPLKTSYTTLLRVFWELHDPTQLNRQGPDVGSQYRSAVFYHDEQQKAEAQQSKRELEQSGRLSGPIVTEIVPAGRFWPAEEYHQRFLEKNPHCNCGSVCRSGPAES